MKSFDLVLYDDSFNVLVSRDGKRFYYFESYNNHLIKPLCVKGIICSSNNPLPIFLTYNMFSFGSLMYDGESNLDVLIIGD